MQLYAYISTFPIFRLPLSQKPNMSQQSSEAMMSVTMIIQHSLYYHQVSAACHVTAAA